MKEIFKPQAVLTICYTIFLVVLSHLFKSSVGELFQIVYWFVVVFHFMIMGVLMAVYHFKEESIKRNGYMASFGFIWILFLLVQVVTFYL